MEDSTEWNGMSNGGKRTRRLGDGSILEGRVRVDMLMATEAFMVEFHHCLAEMVFVRSKGKSVWIWAKARYCGEARILPEHAIGVDLIPGGVLITALQQCFTTSVLSFSIIVPQKRSSQKH